MRGICQQLCRIAASHQHELIPVLQTRLSAEFVADLEGILGEHEGDLEMNVQRSPKPGQASPVFPAMMIYKLINQNILVSTSEHAALPALPVMLIVSSR